MELEAFASSNLIINFTTTPLIKLNAITKLVNHRQFSLPKLHEYLSFPNPALQNLQDGRWRQFGLLVSCPSDDDWKVRISFIHTGYPSCSFISIITLICTCANLISVSPVYAVRTLQLQLLPSSILPLRIVSTTTTTGSSS